jgi:glycosyltransferase involved in cell wall biosynthesis
MQLPEAAAPTVASLKVWIVHQFAVPPSQPGITRHFSLARELVQRGYEVTLIASSFDHLTRRETRLAAGERFAKECIDGVNFLWLRSPAYAGNGIARMWNMAAFALSVLAGICEQQLGTPDVVVGSSPTLFSALAAERLAKRHGVPFVLEVRDLWPQSLVDLGKMPPSHPLVLGLGRIERHLYRKAQRIVTLLSDSTDHMVRKGARRERICELPNGIDMRLAPEPRAPRPAAPFTVMYAGAHGLANGLDTVLDAAALLQQRGWGSRVRIRLVGDGPEKPRLQERARREGLVNVQFDEPVPKTQVFSVLQEADAFLMVLKNSPVFRHGVSPNKLYDYMASARPVVFSVDSPNNPVQSENAGISVPPGDAQAMAEAIAELADMPLELRWQMGLRGRAYVARHHDFRMLGDRLAAILSEALAQRTPRKLPLGGEAIA